jgi:IclR family mhp operon transcriptional activator
MRLRINKMGEMNPERSSYPPVGSVVRALKILKTLNTQRIGTVSSVHAATGQNKSTIVRMLETLIAEGYVAADSLCGGYRVTGRVRELVAGYDGISRIIEVARPLAVELTHKHKWPVGLGILDDNAIRLQFYTGAISPWAHSDTVLQSRPSLVSSAMGRAYLAFCSDDEFETLLKRFRQDHPLDFDDADESELREVVARARRAGYALRDPNIEPRRMTTVSMPIRDEGNVTALISCSFYKTVIGEHEIADKVAKPLAAAVAEIERAIALGPL